MLNIPNCRPTCPLRPITGNRRMLITIIQSLHCLFDVFYCSLFSIGYLCPLYTHVYRNIYFPSPFPTPPVNEQILMLLLLILIKSGVHKLYLLPYCITLLLPLWFVYFRRIEHFIYRYNSIHITVRSHWPPNINE